MGWRVCDGRLKERSEWLGQEKGKTPGQFLFIALPTQTNYSTGAQLGTYLTRCFQFIFVACEPHTFDWNEVGTYLVRCFQPPLRFGRTSAGYAMPPNSQPI